MRRKRAQDLHEKWCEENRTRLGSNTLHSLNILEKRLTNPAGPHGALGAQETCDIDKAAELVDEDAEDDVKEDFFDRIKKNKKNTGKKKNFGGYCCKTKKLIAGLGINRVIKVCDCKEPDSDAKPNESWAMARERKLRRLQPLDTREAKLRMLKMFDQLGEKATDELREYMMEFSRTMILNAHYADPEDLVHDGPMRIADGDGLHESSHASSIIGPGGTKVNDQAEVRDLLRKMDKQHSLERALEQYLKDVQTLW